jgi:hypothetical protein
VYAVSLVVWSFPTPGDAVCRDTYRLVFGEEVSFSAMSAQAVALKISARMELQVAVDLGMLSLSVS